MRFEVYLDQKREFRWRLWSANNKIIADCGEGYQHKQHCIEAITLIMQGVSTSPVLDSTSGQTVLVPLRLQAT
jgi:uncharacterized protein YegP (UPF0339 family)